MPSLTYSVTVSEILWKANPIGWDLKRPRRESKVRVTSLFHGIMLFPSGIFMPELLRLRMQSSDGSILSRSCRTTAEEKSRPRLIGDLLEKISDCRWVGCATPNPVAALVMTRVVRGDAYVGECNPPREVIDMIQTIRSRCPDLRGADFHPQQLLVRTNFSPVSSEETTDWSTPHPSEPPPWWAFLKNLPSHDEALLVIDRKDFLLEYCV